MKERLIGAAVLAALGVWLIPWLLDGPDQVAADGPVSLELPIPEVQNAEVRTEVIDLRTPTGPQSAVIALDGAAAGRRSGERAARSASPSADTSAGTADAARPAGAAASFAAAADAPEDDDVSASGAATTKVSEASAGADGSGAAAAQAGGGAKAAPAATASRAAGTAARPAEPAPAGDWAIQLGSFGDEENARRLAERVTGYGFKPQISNYRAGGRTMYRVRVGPHETRAGAEAAASSLSAHGFIAQVVTVD